MSFKFVTCMTAVPEGDTITLHVLNYATTTETVRVRFWKSGGGGSTLQSDSGDISVGTKGRWGLSWTIPTGTGSGFDGWIEIESSSDKVLAEVLFFRPAPGEPLRYMYYLPGDFGVFDGGDNRVF